MKKPLLTHNGTLDLMFLYHTFFEPLPDTLPAFCTRLNALFPDIYDTRHLLNTRMQLRAEFISEGLSLSDAYKNVITQDSE
jgi:target of EGR1 protein 1